MKWSAEKCDFDARFGSAMGGIPLGMLGRLLPGGKEYAHIDGNVGNVPGGRFQRSELRVVNTEDDGGGSGGEMKDLSLFSCLGVCPHQICSICTFSLYQNMYICCKWSPTTL